MQQAEINRVMEHNELDQKSTTFQKSSHFLNASTVVRSIPRQLSINTFPPNDWNINRLEIIVYSVLILAAEDNILFDVKLIIYALTLIPSI